MAVSTYSLLMLHESEGDLTVYRVAAEAVPENVAAEIDRKCARTRVFGFKSETHKWFTGTLLSTKKNDVMTVAARSYPCRAPTSYPPLGTTISGDHKIIIMKGSDCD